MSGAKTCHRSDGFDGTYKAFDRKQAGDVTDSNLWRLEQRNRVDAKLKPADEEKWNAL